MDKKVIALFCGSFNPPLYSHLLLAQQLLNENTKKVIFVPVSHKYNKRDLIEDKHRYNMLKLICDKNPKFGVSDVEFHSKTQPYTLETMRAMQDQYKEYEVRLVIGTDNLRELKTWYKIENLLQEFKIIVLSRDEDDINKIIKEDKLLSKYKSSFIKSSSAIRTNLSSTLVRNLIKEKKEVRYLLPDEIIDYIKDNNLYL